MLVGNFITLLALCYQTVREEQLDDTVASWRVAIMTKMANMTKIVKPASNGENGESGEKSPKGW